MATRACLSMIAVVALSASVSSGAEITVSDAQQLRRALAAANPGTTIRIAAGTYRGGLSARDLHGTADEPIVIRAADPQTPPVIDGGGSGLQLSDVSHVELHDLVFTGATGNGLNIDDGGSYETPSHHVTLRNIVVRDVGPEGNRDGIKLSGLDDFRIEDCTVERWGAGGSGIDMVGCHNGTITGCTLRHKDGKGGNGIQAKGGTSDVTITRCRFEHAGQRGINIGGSTGMAYFRPKPQGYEAKDVTVENCTFVGSVAPVAFVGVDGALVRFNTIYKPVKWAFRILQETRREDFVPCRNGRFTDNLIVFAGEALTTPVNIGPGTAPESFTLARNAWYCLDRPDRSRPRLPLELEEADGVYGVKPAFVDAAGGDLRLKPEGDLSGVGAQPKGDRQ